MLDQYIEKHGKRLYGLCVTLCGSRFDADDLYQETWLRVCQKIDEYDDRYAFEPWLTRICVNIYRDRLRKSRLEPLFDIFSTSEEKDGVMESVSAQDDGTRENGELRELVDKLPDKLRTAVILHYFNDMDIAKTAAVLGVPPGTVKSRLSKARSILKQFLTEEDGNEDAGI